MFEYKERKRSWKLKEMGKGKRKDKSKKEQEMLEKMSAGIEKQVSEQMEQQKLGNSLQRELNKESGKKKESNPTENPIRSIENPPKKKRKKWKIVLIAIAVILVSAVGSAALVVNNMLNRINHEKPEDVKFLPSDIEDIDLVKATPTPKPTPDPTIEERVINVLLIGEEAIEDDVGRSDSIMIATINTEQNTLKLTSIMRDLLVKIPGYLDNKLNAAFHNGGGVLLTQTIEQNLGIKIDGYVRVDFEKFETIIDKLGGVEITLTNDEADYLNRTNYISNPANRKVHAGTQTLNGNQALGYCRVRYVFSSTNEDGDFGRTARHRIVLNALFDKFKSKNLVDMISIINTLLDDVTTNLDKATIIEYLTAAFSTGATELQQLRVPMEGAYTATKGKAGTEIRYIIIMDEEIVKAELVYFLYGEEHMEEMGVSMDNLISVPKESESPGSKETQDGEGVQSSEEPQPSPTAAPIVDENGFTAGEGILHEE